MASPVVPEPVLDNVLLEEKASPERQFVLYFSFVLYQCCSFNFVTARVRRASVQRAFCSVLFPLVLTGAERPWQQDSLAL